LALIVLVYNYYSDRNDEKETLEAQTALIEKQVRNVSKLVGRPRMLKFTL
jgi:hypothetical protein